MVYQNILLRIFTQKSSVRELLCTEGTEYKPHKEVLQPAETCTNPRINSVSRSSFGKSSPFLAVFNLSLKISWNELLKKNSSNKTKNCFMPIFGSNAHGVIHVLHSEVGEFGTLTN